MWSSCISQQQWIPGTKKVYPWHSSDMWAPTEFLGTYELPLISCHSTYNDPILLLPKATLSWKVQCYILYLISGKFAFVTLCQINGLVSPETRCGKSKAHRFPPSQRSCRSFSKTPCGRIQTTPKTRRVRFDQLCPICSFLAPTCWGASHPDAQIK